MVLPQITAEGHVQKPTQNKILQQFRRYPADFNKEYLDLLTKLCYHLKDQETPEKADLYAACYDCLARDRELATQDFNSIELACRTRPAFVHRKDQVMQMDETLWDQKEDFLQQLLDVEQDVDGHFLYHDLSQTGKSELWLKLNQLYRLSTFVYLYYRNDEIRRLLELILEDIQVGEDLQKLAVGVIKKAATNPELKLLFKSIITKGPTEFSRLRDEFMEVLDIARHALQKRADQGHAQSSTILRTLNKVKDLGQKMTQFQQDMEAKGEEPTDEQVEAWMESNFQELSEDAEDNPAARVFQSMMAEAKKHKDDFKAFVEENKHQDDQDHQEAQEDTPGNTPTEDTVEAPEDTPAETEAGGGTQAETRDAVETTGTK